LITFIIFLILCKYISLIWRKKLSIKVFIFLYSNIYIYYTFLSVDIYLDVIQSTKSSMWYILMAESLFYGKFQSLVYLVIKLKCLATTIRYFGGTLENWVDVISKECGKLNSCYLVIGIVCFSVWNRHISTFCFLIHTYISINLLILIKWIF